MADLPSEIIYNIFSRMPVKSLARFRCLSKPWCNYINDSSFEIMHAKRAKMDDPMLIIFDQDPNHRPNTPCKLSFLKQKVQERGNHTLEMKKNPPVMEFMCNLKKPNDIVLGSCNGLLYSSKLYDGCDKLVVIHPLRKEYYELPTDPSTIESLIRSNGIRDCVEETSGLGFDESTNTFKMVSVVLKEVPYTMVHVLGTNSWRKIPQVPSYPITGEGVFVNGCLHWLMKNDDDDQLTYLGRSVISFDVANEDFSLINPPREKPLGWSKVQLVDLHGEVGYVYNTVDLWHIEVWVLKEKSWVMHCEFKQKPPLLRYGFIKVLGFWNENGDVLMMDIWKKLFVYHLNTESVFEVRFNGCEEKIVADIRMYQCSLFATRYSIKN